MRKLWISSILLVLAALVLGACNGSAPAANTAPAQSNESSAPVQSGEMQHDADAMSDNSYDVHFIDSTLDHHAAVLAMAQQALTESQDVALKDLAQQAMVTAQKEIDWLNAYRKKVHPNAAPMKDNMNMGAMSVSHDGSKPFEYHYAEAMITHHQGSIAMAKEALTKVGHDELKQFAQSMVTVEEAEVALLQQFIK